jgi:arylsulfatase A-like enzyme
MSQSRRSFLHTMCQTGAAGLAASAMPGCAAPVQQPSNVLFIAIDDLNDYLTLLEGYPGLKTPNIDRFAKSALTFRNAYCAGPVCNPSRTSLLTGVAPYKSGVYANPDHWHNSKPVMGATVLPEHFKANGYTTMWSGKIFHGCRPPQDRLDAMWDDDEGHDGGYGPKTTVKHIPESVSRPPMFNYQVWDGLDTDFSDVVNADITAKRLQRTYDKPFFMAMGIYRPHNPWTAPKRFFDMYPLDEIEMPPVLDNDLEDIPPIGIELAHYPVSRKELMETGHWRPLVRSYLASISFMDETFGKIIDALESSQYRDNTIVCAWADHGFHMGEKEHFAKYALWEKTTHSLLMYRVPGMTEAGAQCTTPVNLLDIYPTLNDLCGLPQTAHTLDGLSIRPLLENPNAAWERPAITTYPWGNHAIRSERWRYIRYKDGTEELYDHQNDPNEWKNLAGDAQYDAVKREHAKWLPTINVPAVGPLKKS